MSVELILLIAIMAMNSISSALQAVILKRNGRNMDAAADKFADRIRKQSERAAQQRENDATGSTRDDFSYLDEPWRSIARDMRRKGQL